MILLWPGILGYVGTFGADVELGRRSARDTTRISQNVFVAATLASVYGIALLIPMLLTLPLLFSQEQNYLVEIGRLAMLAAPAIALNSYLNAIALGARQLWIYNTGRFALTVGYVALILLSWVTVGASLTGVVAAYLVSVWCGTLLAAFLLTRSKGSAKSILGKDIRDVARAGAVFAPGYAIYAVTNNLSTLWLVALSDARSLGLYVVALTFANAQQIVSQALAKTAFASMAHIESESETAAIVAFHLRRSIVTLGLLSAFLVVVGQWVVPWLFGAQFSTAAGLITFLVPGAAFFSLGQIVEEMQKARGLATSSVSARLTSAVCISTCAILLVPAAGGTGMAMSFLLGGLAECLLFLHSLRLRLKVSVYDLVVPRSQR